MKRKVTAAVTWTPVDPDAIRRSLWAAWLRRLRKMSNDGNELAETCERQPAPLPELARGLACGACTRQGTRCRLTAINRGGRCKFHGGYSTGPKTARGKAASANNLPRSRAKPLELLTTDRVGPSASPGAVWLREDLKAGNRS